MVKLDRIHQRQYQPPMLTKSIRSSREHESLSKPISLSKSSAILMRMTCKVETILYTRPQLSTPSRSGAAPGRGLRQMIHT